MCYGYNRDFGWNIRKDASRESEEHPEPKAEAKEPEFRAVPRPGREFTAQEPETVPDNWVREKV